MAPFEPTEMEVDPGPPVTEPMNVDFGADADNNRGQDGEDKFQKEIKLSQYVPYRDHLKQSRVNLWNNLKTNMCGAILAQGMPLQEWIYACDQYLTAFGLAVTKSDHIMLIELFWQTLVSMEHDFATMRKLAKLLSRLLSKPHLLSRKDLQLSWRPLYNLWERTLYSPHSLKQTVLFEPEFGGELKELICYARIYFPANSTGEMLSEWRQYMCIYSNQYHKYLSLFKAFLPTMVPPEEHGLGYKLWFDDFMDLWTKLPNQELDHYSCYLQMFSNLAKHSIGYIDWEPYMPMLFARLKKAFNGLIMVNNEVSICAQWIVYMIYPGSSCLANLKQLFAFKLVEHKTMLSAILDEFIKRLRAERYQKKQSWFFFTPESHRITDEIIGDFAVLMFKQFKKLTFTEFDVDYLYKLSLFCSEMMPKEVIDKLDLAQERFYEPNRLQAALQLFSISVFHMVTNENIGEKHRPQVIGIMSKLLKSINTTDHTLCYLHLFAIRSVVVLGIPLEDFSSYATTKKSELNKQQIQLIKHSAELEDFASDFLQCCFTIVESNNEDLFNFSKKGLGMKSLLYEIFVHVLANVSQEKLKTLVNKLYKYMTNRLFENVNCCAILHRMISACLVADNSGYALNKFVKGITENIISAIDDKQKYSDICKSEFFYYGSLLPACFHNGKNLLAHKADLIELFRRVFAIDFQDNSQQINLATNSLSCLFGILCSFYPIDQVFNPKVAQEFQESADFRFDQFLNWPYQVELKDLQIKWHSPEQAEIDFACELYREFIKPQMASLSQWSESKSELSKSHLEKSLNIILSFSGFRDCLPKFSDNSSDDVELYFKDEDIFARDLFGGDNFRDQLVVLMPKVLARLEESLSDNVSALKLIIKILDYAIFPADAVNACTPGDFSLLDEFAAEDVLSACDPSGSTPKDIFNSIYQTLDKKRNFIPTVHTSRIIDYHLKMLSTLKCWTNAQLTTPHKVAIEQLLDLSTCSCTEVRIDAQAILLDVIESYPKSFDSIVPKLVTHLNNHATNYEAFKGTLYLLLGTATKSLLLSDNWNSVLQLWPALVETNFVEKPKIVDIIDNDLLPLFAGYYFTIPIEKIFLSRNFGELFKKASIAHFNVPSQPEIERIEQSIEKSNKLNKQLYNQLIRQFVTTLDAHKLHWRFYNLGFSLLNLLIRYDTTLPREAVEIFLDNLVHDSINIRRTAASGLKKILYLVKPKKETQTIQIGDVEFEKLDMDCYRDRQTFESTLFYDKQHLGYYPNCTYTILINRPVDPQVISDYQFVVNKFKDKAFLDKMFDFYSVEKEKNERMDNLISALDKLSDMVPMDNFGLGMISSVDDNFVKIWQYLFQLFGLFNAELIFPRIDLLLQERKPNHDKLAVEIMVGLVKASSSAFDYDQMVKVKQFFLETFTKHLAKFHTDSKNSWNYLFSSFFANRDMRRYLWVIEFLFSDQLFTEAMTMSCQSSYLNFLSNVLADNWKFTQVSEKVLSRLENNMDYKYQTVRLAVASILSKSLFFPRIGFGFFKGMQPSQSDFIDRIVSRLDQSLAPLLVSMSDETAASMASTKSNTFDNDQEEGQALNNYIETMSTWVFNSLVNKQLIQVEQFVKLLPHLCVIHTKNKSTQNVVSKVISTISVQAYNLKDIDTFATYLDKISTNWNWHSRNEANIFINNYAYSEIYNLHKQPGSIDKFVDIVLRLLSDEVIEVRDSARRTLSNLIAWEIIDLPRKQTLIEQFKVKISDPNPVAKHSAAEGLCAFVLAYPRRLPKFLPDIVLLLCKYLTDPQPIQKTVNESLKSFMKTHQDNWVVHKDKFNAEQLAELSDVSIFSSYIS